MPIPTTAAQIEMAIQAFRAQTEPVLSIWNNRITDMLFRRVFLQRPHTDDMMQMLDDLGIEPPDYRSISYDGLEFKFECRGHNRTIRGHPPMRAEYHFGHTPRPI